MGTSSTMSALSGLLLVLQLVAVLQASPLQDEWEMYKMKHGKEYATPVEEERRRSIWLDNIHNVAEHNKKENDYTMAINQFSDMTNEEFNNYLGYKMPLEKTAPVNRKIFRNVKTPSRVDYPSQEPGPMWQLLGILSYRKHGRSLGQGKWLGKPQRTGDSGLWKWILQWRFDARGIQDGN